MNALQRRAIRAALIIVILFIAGCEQAEEPTPTPAATAIPPLARVATSGAIRASANVEPADIAHLAFPVVGVVDQVLVETGSLVEAGAPLIVLEQTSAGAAVKEAQVTLFQARAALADLADGPRAEEIAMAQADLDAAQARLDQLAEPARAEEVDAAQAGLRAAQSAYRQIFDGPTEEARIEATAALANATAALQQAQSAYNQVSWQNNVSMLPESRQLQEATNNLEAAQARYDALYADPTAAAVAAAQARVEEAQAALDRLLAPGSPNQVAEAEAQLRSAQARLDLLTGAADESALANAAGAVAKAEAALAKSEAALEQLTLTAPFAGTVTRIDVAPGEMVQAGSAVLTLADLETLQVETTDLSERDIARVATGQAADVLVEALAETIPGRVVEIAPEASVIGGDVVYTVIIALEDQPAGLRWGMSADVDILAD